MNDSPKKKRLNPPKMSDNLCILAVSIGKDQKAWLKEAANESRIHNVSAYVRMLIERERDSRKGAE